MNWFQLKGDARLGRCASQKCGAQPTWRLEAGGTGSDYCSGCKEKIDRLRVKAEKLDRDLLPAPKIKH